MNYLIRMASKKAPKKTPKTAPKKTPKKVPKKTPKKVPKKATTPKKKPTKSVDLENIFGLNKEPPKKRGRRSKKIITDVDDVTSSSSNSNENQTAVIARLKINPAKLNKPSASMEEDPEDSFSTDVDDMISSDDIFYNDIPMDDECKKCSQNEKEINKLRSRLEKYEKQDSIEKSTKIYRNNIHFVDSDGNIVEPKKTKIRCWWDCHEFNTLPCYLPNSFTAKSKLVSKTKKSKVKNKPESQYTVIGNFCSFSCALAYNIYYLRDSNVSRRKSLVYKLYREMYDISSQEELEISVAPPREILESFGGIMSIDKYRKGLTFLNKKYIVYVPPMAPLNTLIEEKDIRENIHDNGQDLILKRTKPLVRKNMIKGLTLH